MCTPESTAMRLCLASICFLAAASMAVAGPNAAGTLVVHDTGLTFSSDQTEWPSPAPTCPEVDNRGRAGGLDSAFVWKVYAAFPLAGSPRLREVVLGQFLSGDMTVLASGLPDPTVDVEWPQQGWPTGNGGNRVRFGSTHTESMVECYWFGGYGYAGAGYMIAPHPTQAMVFVDDSVPPQEDPIANLSGLGFGVPGGTHCPWEPTEPGACCFYFSQQCELLTPADCASAGGDFFGGSCEPYPCPLGEPPGACCLPDGSCEVVDQILCAYHGGIWLGFGIPCEPDPCPPTRIESTSWGEVKHRYR